MTSKTFGSLRLSMIEAMLICVFISIFTSAIIIFGSDAKDWMLSIKKSKNFKTTPPSSIERFNPDTNLDTNLVSTLPSNVTCEYPIVYNKPWKTGSTFIYTAINTWARNVGRPTFTCSSWPHTAALTLPECLPASPEPCGIYNGHLIIGTSVDEILQRRFPNYKLLTSTRYAPHRIISSFFQTYGYDDKSVINDAFFLRLEHFLTNVFNPYEIVSWYFKEPKTMFRDCPMSAGEKYDMMNEVSKFDFVIDINLMEESNAILKHFSLFTLSDTDAPINTRGTAHKLSLPIRIKHLLYNVSCYERELHHSLLLRMSSLYEVATGSKCVGHGRMASTTSCLHRIERQRLNDTWIF